MVVVMNIQLEYKDHIGRYRYKIVSRISSDPFVCHIHVSHIIKRASIQCMPVKDLKFNHIHKKNQVWLKCYFAKTVDTVKQLDPNIILMIIQYLVNHKVNWDKFNTLYRQKDMTVILQKAIIQYPILIRYQQ